MAPAAVTEYWRANRRLIAILLSIWALVSCVLPILLARPLDSFRIGQLPAGFWWAQQGSMLVFVLLIFVYAFAMDRIDRKYGVDESDDLLGEPGVEPLEERQ